MHNFGASAWPAMVLKVWDTLIIHFGVAYDHTGFFNSLSASLLLNIFLSFEVGIAHAIANIK